MKQQINLYHDSLRQQTKKPIELINLCILGGGLLLLLSYSLYLVINLQKTKNALETAKGQLQATETELRNLHAQYPKIQLNPMLKDEITRSIIAIKEITAVKQLLTEQRSDQNSGFSSYFTALATQSTPEIWLKSIHINAHAHQLTLKGSGYRADKIPEMLKKLSHENAFRGKKFTQLAVTPDPENEQQIHFTVTNITEPLSE